MRTTTAIARWVRVADPAQAARAGRLVLLGSPLRAGSALVAELRELVTRAGGRDRHGLGRAAGGRRPRPWPCWSGTASVPSISAPAATRCAAEAGRQALIERIAGLSSFLVTGGNQRRLIDGLLFRGEETPVLGR